MAHHRFTDEEIEFMRRELLSYYAENKRDLPWRNLVNTVEDPNQRAYSIWVSEIMLQQTQVATVIEYYNKWIKRWPTILDLAKATLEEVNEMWSGLGYYSRGRRLHEGAQKLTKQRGKKRGQMPPTARDLMKELPGVGRYTAGAIASIAYDQVTGIVDGNVIRVMSRLRLIGADISTQTVSELIWELANKVVDPELPGDFNQSMMELGATICTPKNPQCSICPVNKICKAYRRYHIYRSKNQSTITDTFNKTSADESETDDDNAEIYRGIVDVNKMSEDEDNKAGIMVDIIVGDKNSYDGDTNGDDSGKAIIEENKFGVSKYDFNLTDIEDFPDCKFCLSTEQPWNPHLGVTNYPRKPKKKPPRAERFISVIIEHNNKFLFTQRPAKGLLANMWEFPLTEIEKENKEVIENNVIRKEMNRRFSFSDFDVIRLCGESSHVFSHRCHLYRIYHAVLRDSPATVEDADGRSTKWMTREEANGAAITTAIKKIMNVKDKCKKVKRKRDTGDSKSQQTLDKLFTKKTKN